MSPERSTSEELDECREQLERYRRATEDALQQLDWCIGYLHGAGKRKLAQSLGRNRAYIRSQLMQREEQAVPTQTVPEGDEET